MLAGSDDYGQLWSVVKMVLFLSHGEATVERGFSVNRQVDDDAHSAVDVYRRIYVDVYMNISDTVTMAYYYYYYYYY